MEVVRLIHVTIERMYSERHVAIDGVLFMKHGLQSKVIDNRVINYNCFFFSWRRIIACTCLLCSAVMTAHTLLNLDPGDAEPPPSIIQQYSQHSPSWKQLVSH